MIDSGLPLPVDRGRPSAHFTPPSGWMNDPCGLVRLGESFHLFYQHNPHGTHWDDMHWGHATSEDLLHWQHHPIAIAPDELGMIFTGCVVVDHANTAGFGNGTLVAVFTQDGARGQVQSIAWSTDEGMTWTTHAANPVLARPGEPDYRDPKVFWCEAGEEAAWVMVLAVGQELEFYRSPNLRDWTLASTLRPDLRDDIGLEVPDLLQTPHPDGGHTWLLLYSTQTLGQQNIPRHVHAITGSFDGFTFAPGGPSRLLDAGPSFYAALTWADLEAGPICIGWMDESQGPPRDASLPWCGRLSIPRRVSIEGTAAATAIIQRPLLTTATEHALEVAQRTTSQIDLAGEATIVRFHGLDGAAGAITFSVVAEDGAQVVEVRADTHSVVVAVPGHPETTLPLSPGLEPLTIILDAGSIEVFADGGQAVASATLPAGQPAVASIDNTTDSPMTVLHGPVVAVGGDATP